jgi:hypothetical protein
MNFYVGLHRPQHAHRFDRCMVSVNVIRDRKSAFGVNRWIMDSGAFTTVTKHGGYPEGPEEYAEQVNRWLWNGHMEAAVSQDYMCEPFALEATGKTIEEHQALTVERCDALRQLVPCGYIMPVIQGWEPEDYARHVAMYGPLLRDGMWVGVGSVCKRNSNASAIENVLGAIYRERPDLKLHGFGLKATALASATVRDLLASADSMAWSYAARMAGRNANDPAEAEAFVRRIESQEPQTCLWGVKRFESEAA